MTDPPAPAHPPGSAELLRTFWADAALAPERWPYLEFQARRYPAIARFLRPYGPWTGRRVLDVGGGVGSLSVALAAELGGSFDVAEYHRAEGAHLDALQRRGIDRAFSVDLTRPDPLRELPTGYDAILLVEVLEHLLVNPLWLFRSIWDHLAPGGLFFLTTPNQARAGNRLRLLLGRSIKEKGRYPWDGAPVYGHVVEFSRAELDLLARAESLAPDRAEVVQQLPSVRPGSGARAMVRLLNTGLARRWELGDDILASFRKVPRSPDGRCPVPLDVSGRL